MPKSTVRKKLNKTNKKNSNEVSVNNKSKMSEILLEYTQPMFQENFTVEMKTKAIDMAILAWNLSLIPEETRAERREEIITSASINEEDRQEYIKMLDFMVEIKKKCYGNIKRLIMNYTIEERLDEEIYLTVGSTDIKNLKINV